MMLPKAKTLSNHEIVTLAVYLLGGDSKRIDTEDVAVKSNELAPGRFTWRKYADHFAQVFRRVVGVTPTEFRSSL
jgi:hypothetical protein